MNFGGIKLQIRYDITFLKKCRFSWSVTLLQRWDFRYRSWGGKIARSHCAVCTSCLLASDIR